jgi:hypothetical protein
MMITRAALMMTTCDADADADADADVLANALPPI